MSNSIELEYDNDDFKQWFIVGNYGRVMYPYNMPEEKIKEVRNEAFLFNAAKDLLFALEFLMEVRRMEQDRNHVDIFEEDEIQKYQQKAKLAALKAIAKARGQS